MLFSYWFRDVMWVLIISVKLHREFWQPKWFDYFIKHVNIKIINYNLISALHIAVIIFAFSPFVICIWSWLIHYLSMYTPQSCKDWLVEWQNDILEQQPPPSREQSRSGSALSAMQSACGQGITSAWPQRCACLCSSACHLVCWLDSSVVWSWGCILSGYRVAV